MKSVAFSASPRRYDQMWYLDETGLETLRVNLTKDGAVAVPAGEACMSPLDLSEAFFSGVPHDENWGLMFRDEGYPTFA